VYRGLRKMVMSWSLGLVLVGVAAFVSADPPKPLDEIMEEVQQVNKALIKFNRMTKAQFDEPGRGEQVAKEAEKMAALMKEVLRHAPQEDQKEKPKKVWVESAEDVKKAAADMATAARKKDLAAYKTAFKRMDNACTACHDIFRD